MKHRLSIKCILPVALILIFAPIRPARVHAAQGKPLTQSDLLKLLSGGVYNSRIAAIVHDRGIAFPPTKRNLDLLQRAGADSVLRHAIIAARRFPSRAEANADGASHSRQLSQSAPSLPPAQPRNTLDIHQRQASSPNLANATLLLKPAPAHPAATIASQNPGPAGATITMENWSDYQQYMPLGMIELFKGAHFWKMPADIKINIGPTITERPPSGYAEATARYSGNVRVVHLANGHNDIQNYSGGEPFPNPQEPDKGYKLLADLWFAYIPHLLAGASGNPMSTCSETRHGYVSCVRLSYVLRQTAYNTDMGVPEREPTAGNAWYTEWTSVEEPEELKYTTRLKIYPRDNQRTPEVYTFVPSLRRWIRGSLLSRCSPVSGTDYTEDDYKRVGFNGGIGDFQAQFLGHRKILALAGDYTPLGGDFPKNYYMPLGWPKPSWGEWQVRDVDVIDVRRIPGEEKGYCYGKRIIYEDSDTRYAVWEDAYDGRMRLWKTALLAQRTIGATLLGDVPGAFTSSAWDLKNDYLTVTSTESKDGRDVLVDYDVPGEYQNLISYSTPAGLAQIMK